MDKLLIILILLLIINFFNNYELFYWTGSISTRNTKRMIYDIRGDPNSCDCRQGNSCGKYGSFIYKLFPYIYHVFNPYYK